MALQSAALEAVLEELGHERLRLRESGDALADIAGGKDAELAPERAGAAAVIGDGDDGGEVGGVELESAQEGGKAGATADGDDAGAALGGAVIVDDVDEALLPFAGAEEGGEERCVEFPDGEEHEADGGSDEEGATPDAGDVLQGEDGDPAGEGVGDVDLTQDVGEAEAHDRDGEHEEGEPSFDVHARCEPLEEITPA